MVKDTEVTKFIKQKLSEIDIDSLSKPDAVTPYDLQEYLMDDKIDGIEGYIVTIKNNDRCYEYLNGEKKLKPKFKEVLDALNKDIEKYKLYRDCVYILGNYNNREERINNRIGNYSVEHNLNSQQLKLLDTINMTKLDDLSCYDITAIAKYLITNNPKNNMPLLNTIFEFIFDKYNGEKLKEEEYIYISGLNNMIEHIMHMSITDTNTKQYLKNRKKGIDKIVNAYNKKKVDSYDSRYDFIEGIIDDGSSFNKALDDFPDIINIRDKIGNPLSYNIMVKYLDAYFLELRGIESKITKEYYLEIYNKIIHSTGYEITPIDEEEFDVLRECFVKASSIVFADNLKVVKSLEEIDGLTNKK